MVLISDSYGKINMVLFLFTPRKCFALTPPSKSGVIDKRTNMPELDWQLGYPMAILMMFSSAAGTYLFFKRKGWL